MRLAWLRPQTLEDRNILNFTIDTAWQGLMMGGISAFISVFVVRLGASSLWVSLLTSLPALITVLLSFPAGTYVDRHADPVRLTNVTRWFHRGGFLLIALLPFFVQRYLAEWVVVIWTLTAVPGALLNLSWTVVVAEIIPPRRRASVNGMRWSLLSLVIAISVALFGYLLENTPFPLGYQIVFVASFVGGMAGIYYFGKLVLPEKATAASAPLQVRRAAWPERLREYGRDLRCAPLFVRYLLTTSVLRLALNLPTALYSIYWVRELGASDLWIGWRTTANGLALIVGYYLWGRVATRKGHFPVLIACTLGSGLYPALTAIVVAQAWLPIVALVGGLFSTGLDLAFFDTLLHICPPEKRSAYVALNTVLANLVIFAAPLLGSALSEWVGIRAVLWLASVVHIVSAILFAVFRVASE